MTARVWRADGGYQDVPQDVPKPPANQPAMLCFPGYGYGYGYGYPPWMCQNFIEGPIPVGGLWSPPPPYANLSPPQQAPPAPQPPAAPEAPQPPAAPEAPEPPAAPETSQPPPPKKENASAPPQVPEGGNYMFDTDHTMVHIFNKAAPVWTEKYRKQKLKFKMFKISINFSIKMIIENVLKKQGDDCKGWAATETFEHGGGVWVKGSTIEYDSDKSSGTLRGMGWSAKRGDSLPPVWVVVHKVDFK